MAAEHRGRIWVDGCFDFFHHGHAGALNQARALGDALAVGIHTDEEILANKGPVVMHLDEREFAVDACRWTSSVVSGAPYVTDPKVMDDNGCSYVAHGDDITTDADGNDCYQEVKDMGRFLEFARTPNISTTDLISRMLSTSKSHHREVGTEFLKSPEALRRFKMYATNRSARDPYAGVWNYTSADLENFVQPAAEVPHNAFYVEGAFDLFHCGHIEFLKKSKEAAGKDNALIVGLRSDAAVNEVRGSNNPIMNIFERALCVLQCKYVDGVILNVPLNVEGAQWVDLLRRRAELNVVRVLHGSKASDPANEGVGQWAKQHGIFDRIEPGKYAFLRTSTIVDRVLTNRSQYEERQRKKGVKADNELDLQTQERAKRKEGGSE